VGIDHTVAVGVGAGQRAGGGDVGIGGVIGRRRCGIRRHVGRTGGGIVGRGIGIGRHLGRAVRGAVGRRRGGHRAAVGGGSVGAAGGVGAFRRRRGAGIG